MKIDGNLVENLTTEAETSIDTTQLTDGSHVLNVTVVDVNHNTTYHEVTFVVRNTSGTKFSVETPTENEQVSDMMEVKGNVTAGKLAYATISIDGHEVANVTNLTGHTFDTTSVNDGTHHLNITAHDVNGKVTYRTVDFSVNNAAAAANGQDNTLLVAAIGIFIIVIAAVALLAVRRDDDGKT